MAVIIVAGTNPVIIDQPEDNLDGRFITEVLVPLIRRQKLNRQIVLITRDANIVIGSDSDLIHLLEKGEDRTSMQPITIENVENRDNYIWILDGGAEAFKIWERKYELN